MLSLPATVALTREQRVSALWATARAIQVFRGKNPVDREAMGRRVLHLKATEPWTPWRLDRGSREEELWALVAGALVAGVDVSDTDQVAAYHLKESGVFGPAALLEPPEGFQGVSPSGAVVPAGVDSDSVQWMEDGPDGLTFQSVTPVVVWVRVVGGSFVGADGNVVVHLPRRGKSRDPVTISLGEFYALLGMAPDAPPYDPLKDVPPGVSSRREPPGVELDALARDTGLHHGAGEVSAETRVTVLRLVRALRRVFGEAIEADRGVRGGRYERLLEGIGALERMRANDPEISQHSPLRVDMLDFLVREHTPGRAPDIAGREALLDFAAARVRADPGARLTKALPLLVDGRPLGLALRQWGKGADGWVRRVLSLPATVPLTRHEVASALWATARAVQVVRGKNPVDREAMGRRVLHLQATATWTPWYSNQGSREEELWAVVAGAVVAGVDVSDTDRLAAYQRSSQRTGRPAFGYSAPVMPSASGPGAPLGIIALPDPATGVPGRRTAATRQQVAAEATPPAAGLSASNPSPPVDSAVDDAGRPTSPEYPEPDYWNSPWTGLRTATSPGEIVAQEISAEGRVVGLASFGARDWSLREPFYAGLRGVTHYTEWSRGPGGIDVARRRAMPATSSGGTFYWASHGLSGGFSVTGPDGLPSGATGETVGRLLAEHLRGTNFTSITSTSCARGDLADTVRKAEAIAEATGLDVFISTGRSAVTPGGRSAILSLLENPDGTPTGFLRVVPAARSGPALPRPPAERVAPAGQTVLPGNPWSVARWRIPGGVDSVHFAPLYDRRDWRLLSYQYEFALARHIAARPQTRAVLIDAVARLHARLTDLHGRQGADRTFGFADAAAGGNPPAQGVTLADFLAHATVPRLMGVFGLAAYGSAPTSLRNSEPGRIGSPHPPHPRGHRQGAYRLAHDDRGFRYVGGTVGPALWLLQAYRLLGTDPAHVAEFRAGVVAWSVLTDNQSLAEVVRASHLAGVGTDEEHAAVSRDGAGLHLWARRALAPDLPLRLPHHAAYDATTHYRTAYGVQVPEDIQAALSVALSGAEADDDDPAERVTVTKDWLERFGDAGRRAITTLAPGHLTALYRYTSSDHELFRLFVQTSRFGTVTARGLFRHRVWDLVLDDAKNDEVRPPILQVSELDDAVFELTDIQGRRRSARLRSRLGGEHPADVAEVAEVRRRVDRVADRLMGELALHVGMATEALEMLPPVAGPVWWGDWMPGPLDDPEATALLHDRTLFLTGFRGTTERDQLAVRYAQDYAGETQTRHPVVGYLPWSSAPLISPFSMWPSEEEVLYPPGRAFTVLAREVRQQQSADMHGQRVDLKFAHLTVAERPQYPPRAYRNADGTPPTPARPGPAPTPAPDLIPGTSHVPPSTSDLPQGSTAPKGSSTAPGVSSTDAGDLDDTSAGRDPVHGVPDGATAEDLHTRATTGQDTGTPPPTVTPVIQEPDGFGPSGERSRTMAGNTDPDPPDLGDPVPLETQLERYRPARLLTGADGLRPRPSPREVTFEDGSRLPAALIRPGSDPRDSDPDGAPPGSPTGLLPGPGVLTLRSPELAARQILDHLPQTVRARFDEAELLRLLTDQPSAFTAPRGARFVGREKSGVGLEMTVEAIPYHRWERFSDVGGATVHVETVHRGQAGTGGGRSVGFGRRIAAAIGMVGADEADFFLRMLVSLGWSRKTDYAQGTSAFHQAEYWGWEGSHLHLDDVYYHVRVERVTEAPKTTGTTDPTAPPVPGPHWQRTEVHTAQFGMRDGLSWRLPDEFTVPFTGPRRAPQTLTFPDGVEPRLTGSTGLYLTTPPEEVALALSGARPGSSAHRTLVSYVRPGSLLGLFGRLTGPVSGPELTRGSGQHPMGHLVVELSVPHHAELVTESLKAEMLDIAQTTYHNQRAHVRETRLGLQLSVGPNHTISGPETDVRLQVGPAVGIDPATGRAHYQGTDTARRVRGRARNCQMAFYWVKRTLRVRKAGEPSSAALPVEVVSLEWISTQDARRLAGWDSRTPGRTGPNPHAEPPVPWYLTREDPVHLGGQVRAEGFRPQAQVQAQPAVTDQQTPSPVAQEGTPPATRQPPAPQDGAAPQDPMKVFTDTVLDTLHRAYPSMFVPPLMLSHPRLARLWYGDGRLRTALHNDRQVREALNRPTLAQSLDELTTTGVPVTLTEDRKAYRGHHTLTLRARLTDRRFETTMSERSVFNALTGNEVSGQGQQESSTYSAGFVAGISPRDHDKAPGADLPRRIGNTLLGVRYARTYQKGTRNTVTVAHDHLTNQHHTNLYSYQVELGATFEGHRRPAGWTRLLTVGLLGAGLFVSKVQERPLFSRGTEAVGRVELAVPVAHGSDRHAPADPPAGTAPAPTATPLPQRLSATEADQLLDGARPLPTSNPDDQEVVRRLLSAPHVVLSAEGGPQRQQLMQDTADRASGTSWHVSAPGAPVRTALRRAMANLSVASQLGQYLGPFGSRITGLNGAGPLQTHYLKAAVRGELHNVRVMSDPKPAGLESTIGNEHRAVASASTVSRWTLGVQGGYLPLQQFPGEQAVVGSYATALQYAWSKGRGVSQALTRGRNTMLTFGGRMYLVVADATETVAVRDRWTAAMGTVGTRAAARVSSVTERLSERLGRGLSPRRAAAARQKIRDAVMFHLPMQDAIEAGLAPDGLSTTTPLNLGGGYRVPDLLDRRRFQTYPSGQLDASHAAQELLPSLEKIGVPSHDREQVLQRLSPDFLRAHLHELTTDGMSLPVRYRAWSDPFHLPVGGSPGQVRFKLTPDTTTVQRLRTGYEVRDYRTISRAAAVSTSQDRGTDVTLSAGERSTGAGALVANPSLQGTAANQRASNRTETDASTAMPHIVTTQAHAEIVTSYTLTVTMTDVAGDPMAPQSVAPVGTLNEIVPAGLLTPVGVGDNHALTEQDVPEPERAVRMLTAEQARSQGIADWRALGDGTTGGDSGILPFDDRIGSGILAVDIRGAAGVHDALTLATARADGAPNDDDLGLRHTGNSLAGRVRMARFTPLTGLGTAPAQAQQEATSQGGLIAGFREALGPDGSALPAQSSAHMAGQSHTADSRLYAKMHRRGARLLAVENNPRMEAMQQHKTSDVLEDGITDSIEGAVGSAPLLSAPLLGTINPGVINPGVIAPIGGAKDGTALNGAADTTLGTHIKVLTHRSMLFAVPVSWLAVAEVHHRITDSRPLRALGKARRGPRAAEAETTALVWLREDLARDYGLLDDTTYPDKVAKAWDAMAEAAADLTTAEKEYYDARARVREAWLSLTPQQRGALGDDDPTSATEPPPDLAQAPAVVTWQAARDEAQRWAARTDAAAADHHRLHLAASRLTAHHQSSASAPVPDQPQEYAPPQWRSEAPKPYAITDSSDTLPRTLTSPDKATVREVHDMPHDGASFFHALLATAKVRGHDQLSRLLGSGDLADRFTAAPGDPAVTAEAIGAARNTLAWALREDSNEDLLDALAPDDADTFTQDELTAAGVTLTTAQQAEFDAFGRLPLTYWPTQDQRVKLACVALLRPFASEPSPRAAAGQPGSVPATPERRAGDNGGADLLPALAARVLGTPLTVVTGDGRDQLFLPHGGDPAAVRPAADPVLFYADGFFHAALPPGTPAPVTAALPAPTTAETSDADTKQAAKPPLHRSHTTAPWLPPADSSHPPYRLARDGILTAPDGATYTQGMPTGRGNGFFGALSTALVQAAGRPGADQREAARLKRHARSRPAQLMRLHGLPGDAAERDALFAPPPPVPLYGAATPSTEAQERHLRRHLTGATWGPRADRAVAEWAAGATGTTVTLIEENGTPHTYPGPAGENGPHVRLRRRGGDFVPLVPRTPAPATAPGTQTTPNKGAQTDSTVVDVTTTEWAGETSLFAPSGGVGVPSSAGVPAPPDGNGRSEPSEEAGREYEGALGAYRRAVRAVEVLRGRVRGGGPGGSGDVAGLDAALGEVGRAQGWLEESLDRLRDVGDAAADAVVAEMVPRVRRTDDERRRTAALVTVEDLGEDWPRLADDVLTLADLTAAGITLGAGPAVQVALSGSVRVGDSEIDRVGYVRLLMVRPGPWSEALDVIAARAARRIWREAYVDFVLARGRASGVMAGRDLEEVWRRAMSLVLPLELHPVRADSRHARADYIGAVRQVAEHLAVPRAGAVSAVLEADRLRHGLGLPPRLRGGAPGGPPVGSEQDSPSGGVGVPSSSAGVPGSLVVPGTLPGAGDPMLAPEYLITGRSGGGQGRNWTGMPVSRVDMGVVRVLQTRPGVAPKLFSQGPAPWPETAFVVPGKWENGRVRLPDGRVLNGEGLAALLAADAELAKLPDVHVVLAISFAGDQYMQLLRVVADRLRRTVWGPSGLILLQPDLVPNAHVLVLWDRDPVAPVGGWVSVEPSAATGPYEDREWTALDGTKFYDSDVLTRPFADEKHERYGRMAFRPEDGLRVREDTYRVFRRIRELVHQVPADAGYLEAGTEPFSLGSAVYVYSSHGRPGGMALPLLDGRTVRLGARDAAKYIAGLREVRELPQDHQLHEAICWSGSAGDPRLPQATHAPSPHVDDSLAGASLSQLVANASRRVTGGFTRASGHAILTILDPQRVSFSAANGERGRYIRHRPEPLELELDALAREAGLHHGAGEVSAETRETMLRLVRALREVFGHGIEDDRGVPGGRYERVLKGIGALERMRANDPAISSFTPLRMDMLVFLVR
ncbi:lonely Cys domain-containing protein, partial [Streptomyces sp. SYSU K217416]